MVDKRWFTGLAYKRTMLSQFHHPMLGRWALLLSATGAAFLALVATGAPSA